MNAYVVRIPEERTSQRYYEPPEPWWPIGVFLAETPAQAKRDALDAWIGSGVERDDWNALRVRLLRYDIRVYDGESGSDVEARRGEVPFGDPLAETLWLRIHELDDHGGASCDCPEMEWDDATGDWKAVEV